MVQETNLQYPKVSMAITSSFIVVVRMVLVGRDSLRSNFQIYRRWREKLGRERRAHRHEVGRVLAIGFDFEDILYSLEGGLYRHLSCVSIPVHLAK